MTKINQQKFSIKKMKKDKKNKVKNTNQKSFFFEDYLETNLKKKVINQRLVSEDRIYILFFFFLSLILVIGLALGLTWSIKIFIFLVSNIYTIWILVSIWNCAYNVKKKIWGDLSRLLVIINTIFLILTYTGILPWPLAEM